MSKADELFKELGYEKADESFSSILYEKNISLSERVYIYFKLDEKLVQAEYVDDDYEMRGASYLNMQELKAINQKCKEMGWLDEWRR